VFLVGQVAVGSYIVFAARTPQSSHSDTELLVGNVITDEVGSAFDAYDLHSRYGVGANETCGVCGLNARCVQRLSRRRDRARRVHRGR
jgi:hypothetical protein